MNNATVLLVLFAAIATFSSAAATAQFSYSDPVVDVCPCDFTQQGFHLTGAQGAQYELQTNSDGALQVIAPSTATSNENQRITVAVSCDATLGTKLFQINALQDGATVASKLFYINVVPCTSLKLKKTSAQAFCPNRTVFQLELSNEGGDFQAGDLSAQAKRASVDIAPSFYSLAPGEKTIIEVRASLPARDAFARGSQTFQVSAIDASGETKASTTLGFATPLCPLPPAIVEQNPQATLPDSVQLPSTSTTQTATSIQLPQAGLPQIDVSSALSNASSAAYNFSANLTGRVTVSQTTIYILLVILALFAIVLYSLYREQNLQRSDATAAAERNRRLSAIRTNAF